jgi:hypothetical protein
MLSIATITVAQVSFDPGNGCLNVIDVSSSQGLGDYGDKCISANYLHEVFINEQFAIGAGIGYSHHKKYDFSAIPVFLSTHYFFLDKRFSPFVNLRVGGFGMFGKKNVDTSQKYSISNKKTDFNLFVSPAIGVKVHITPDIGIMASINDGVYLINAFDTQRNNYRNKFIHDLGISIGICFQIDGW